MHVSKSMLQASAALPGNLCQLLIHQHSANHRLLNLVTGYDKMETDPEHVRRKPPNWALLAIGGGQTCSNLADIQLTI